MNEGPDLPETSLSLDEWKKLFIERFGEPYCDNDDDWEEALEEFKARYTAEKQFYATQEFMETSIYHNMDPEGKKVVQDIYNGLERLAFCECDRDTYGDCCYYCLQVARRNRYGFQIHNTDCVCNECTYGDANPFRSDY